ncbi:unnamed protein product [Dovyalis caffra]|uniref:Potassium transporter n=1 Tax=Dovyalis caffra TaxID=77055 RepID=A0AAV1SPE3_9ROSI|nr:unnamed protein product [Dovyalis caffra]
MASGGKSNEEIDYKSRIWVLDQKLDQPIDAEAKKLRNKYEDKLAFQSLGVVYGDLGTSPLYVFYNTFPDGIEDPEDLIGALSLIIYSLTLIPLLKYVLIVCRANDNGQGGTFALYSLLCQHAKVKTIPDQDNTDEQLTTYSRSTFHEQSFAAKTKRWLEEHAFRKNALLVLVLVGSSMVIGDGILTPAISVLSAVQGIKLDHPNMNSDVVVLVAVVILVGLFCMQHHGVDRVSWLFAPIVLLWFLLIGGIGLFNIWKYDTGVLKAFSPIYIYRYFRRGGRDSWLSLGGIMLSITGTEALFADLSHFPVPSIQIAFTTVVFPCLLFAYSGQAAYLMKNTNHVVDAFYSSIPDIIYWPVLLVATAAAVVASQATICATFSLIKQALALGCFPRVRIVHTSKRFLSHIYLPDINWILMILCVGVTAGFKNQSQIGNASGTAVVIVMLVTTLLMILVMLLIWRCHWIIVLIFTGLSLVVEVTYFSSVLCKVNQGGWVPLVIAFAFFIIMYVWHYGTKKRYEFEVHSKVSMAWILGLGPSLGLVRVPGIGLVYTELARGVPHMAIKTSIRDEDFEKKLFDGLYTFVRLESMMDGCSDSDDYSIYGQETEQPSDVLLNHTGNTMPLNVDATISSGDSIISVNGHLQNNTATASSGLLSSPAEVNELEFLSVCRDAGVVHILGNTEVLARRDSKFCKKIAIDYIYAFLRKICTQNSAALNVPHESLLNVGQIIHV